MVDGKRIKEPRRQMTPRQRKILRFIIAFVAKNGYSPCYREVLVGIREDTYRSSMQRPIQALEELGYVVKVPAATRTIRVTEAGRAAARGE